VSAPTGEPAPTGALDCHPLTPERWGALEALFGPQGACAGCWCMWWRLSAGTWRAGAGEGNRQALRALVEGGEVPGLLGYVDGAPAAWCSLGPRPRFPRFDRSSIARPVDDEPVWTVVCFFVERRYRGRGLTRALLRAAVAWAGEQGARILEAYPIDTAGRRRRDDALWTGLASTFRAVGFQEVARRSPTRPVMRYFVEW
jgi:GNAT superfamily N-acetyltransferase